MSRLEGLRTSLARRTAQLTTPSDPAGRARSDARAVIGDLPRAAEADQVVRRARRLMRQAALDEFVREGVTLVQLPEPWGRADLRRADIPGDAAFQDFISEVLAAIDIAPSPLDRDDAIELRRAPASHDAYGMSLEVAADLASYLLTQAWTIQQATRAQEAAQAPLGEVSLPSDAPTCEDFIAEQARIIREQVRETLVRVVTVPLELRAAQDKHDQTQQPSDVAPGEPGSSPDTAGAGESSTQPSVIDQARALGGFVTSETGKRTLGVMRTVGTRAFQAYQHTERRPAAQDDDPVTPPPSPSTDA